MPGQARAHHDMRSFDYSASQTGLSHRIGIADARSIATIVLLMAFAAAIALVVYAIVACMTYVPAMLSDVVDGPAPQVAPSDLRNT